MPATHLTRLRRLAGANLTLSLIDLEGPLSETIYLCAELRYLDLSKNRLTGALPVGALASLPLTGLYLVGNRLADPKPTAPTSSRHLPRCLVSVDRGPPPMAAIAETAAPWPMRRPLSPSRRGWRRRPRRRLLQRCTATTRPRRRLRPRPSRTCATSSPRRSGASCGRCATSKIWSVK